MEPHRNHLGQPIGVPLPGWTPRSPPPPRTPMIGRFCRVEPLDAERHAAQLFAADSEDADGRGWTYLPRGPYPAFAPYRDWVETAARSEDPLYHAIVDDSGAAVGA